MVAPAGIEFPAGRNPWQGRLTAQTARSNFQFLGKNNSDIAIPPLRLTKV